MNVDLQNRQYQKKYAAGLPGDDPAGKRNLDGEVRRCHALKVIHGYGSSGQGGAIKAACLKLCADRKKSGVIRHYVRGEDFNPFTADGRKAIEICPQLKNDVDYGRQNDGITVILF